MATVVGPKGQVVIEKPIRDALGVTPGHVAVQQLVGDHVEIRFFPPDHNQSLRGVLEAAVEYRVAREDWGQAREAAWTAAAREAATKGVSESAGPASPVPGSHHPSPGAQDLTDEAPDDAGGRRHPRRPTHGGWIT